MRNPKEIGKDAEDRVINIAKSLGYNAYHANLIDDYGGGKTDVVINGVQVQVSCQPKSKNSCEKLSKMGVINISAGDSITDDILAKSILKLFS